MTELKNDDETNLYRWTPQLFEEAKSQARDMTLEKLPQFIDLCMRRCSRDDQAIGAMVLAGLAACTAGLRLRKQKPSATQVALGALMLYKEIMRLPGPFRVIAYERMLSPGNLKHFEPVIDWQASQWLTEEATARLQWPGLDPQLKNWLSAIALGRFPYGWSEEKVPLPDGFRRRQ